VGTAVLAYKLGRYVYAFSPSGTRWDVLELPEGVSAAPSAGSDRLIVEGGGHIFTFRTRSGVWDDLDLNAMLNASEDGEEKTKPKE
jgi:hypothetical protein